MERKERKMKEKTEIINDDSRQEFMIGQGEKCGIQERGTEEEREREREREREKRDFEEEKAGKAETKEKDDRKVGWSSKLKVVLKHRSRSSEKENEKF